jgi:hypothetical protein
MEPEAEYRKVPKEDAVVKPVVGLRKRHRDWNLAAERRQKQKKRTQGYCGSRKRMTAGGRRMTHCARVAWRKRGVVRKDCTRAKIAQATWRVGPLRKNLWTHHEGRRGTKDLVGKWPLYLKKKRATAICIGGWSSTQLSPLGRGGLTYKALRMFLELKFVKQANRMSSRLQRMMNWTFWRGWPPPKQKRNCTQSRSR